VFGIFFCPITKGILGIVTFAITKKKEPNGFPFFEVVFSNK